MPYYPKAEAPNAQPYWCPNCAAWFLPQCGPVQLSCCVIHQPGDCCHHGETKLVAEGTQPQPAFVPYWPVPVPTYTPWWIGPVTVRSGDATTVTSDLAPPISANVLVTWGKSMMGGDTSHMVDS